MYTVAQPGALPLEAHPTHADSHVHHGFFRTYVWSHDHKMIGKQYLFTSMIFGAISGILAMGVRWQLGFPGKPVSRSSGTCCRATSWTPRPARSCRAGTTCS